MHQPYIVRLADIRWGGRPSSENGRVTGKGLGCGLILDGSWDTEDKRPLDEYLWSYVYSRSTLQIFRDGVPYTQTDHYKEIASVVRRGFFRDWKARGCRSEEDIQRYFAQLESTFRSIRDHGYRTQAERGSKRWYDEIKVFVDRNGELHKQQGGGHHRLAMARTLHVERIPVLIIGVHRQWAEAAQREFGEDIITSVDRRIQRDIACR